MGPFQKTWMGITVFATSLAIADDTPLEVLAMNGAPVMVSPSEVKRAYLSLVERKSTHAEKIATNEDGSVAINRPTFEYNGRPLRISWNISNAIGVCKRFGFDTSVGNEYERITNDDTTASLSEDGRLRDLTPSEGNSHRTVLQTVACR